MGAKQLAIVLAPNILHSDDHLSDPSAIVVALATTNQVVLKLINYFEDGKFAQKPKSERKNPQSNEKILQQIASTGNSPKTPVRERRVPLSSLKPPSKVKNPGSPDTLRHKNPIMITKNSKEDEEIISGDRATSEFRIVTEEFVNVNIDEPSEIMSIEQIELQRRNSISNIQRTNHKPLANSDPNIFSQKTMSCSGGWIKGVLKKGEEPDKS